MTHKSISIGGASGFWGDSSIALPQLLEHDGLDYISFDYLAEVTMSILARARAKDPSLGYATDFVSLIARHLPRIAERKVKLIAIDEMRHAEMFAERVKELGGEPVTEHGAKVQKGQKVEAMFAFDAKLEDNTIDVYNQFAAVCRENGDSISMKLFETIIDEEQIHYNYFDND